MDTDVKSYELEYTGENERTVHTEGARIFLRRTDPYGFWNISFERGSPPSYLEGSFTSLDVALATVRNYITKARAQYENSERERVRTAKAKAQASAA